MDVPGREPRLIRPVHPSLEGISAWISSVGAAVALGDLDGDGLPNDVAHVEPRTDQVTIAPVPGTMNRYPSFRLCPEPLPYDSTTMAPMGCLPADLNEDGLMDLLVVYWGRTPVAFLRHGGGTEPVGGPVRLDASLYKPCEVQTSGERWFTNAVCQADLDGDGHGDLIIGNYFPDGARILDVNAPGIEPMQASMSRAYNGGREHFLLWSAAKAGNDPDVAYQDTDTGLKADCLTGWTLAVGAADLDADLLPEVYIANDFGPDRLLHNLSRPGVLRFAVLEGERQLTTPRSNVLGRDSFKGMGVEFADLNGDGELDIYVSNITTEFGLQESQLAFLGTGETSVMAGGFAPFRDAGERLGLARTGWCWEARAGDFDNDGVPELMQATGFVRGTKNRWPELQELAMGNDALLHLPACWPHVREGDDLSGLSFNAFYVRSGSGRFVDLSEEVGLAAPQVSRGIATADVDGDGSLDFAVANQWETSYFYHNDAASPGSFLGLHVLVPLRTDAPSLTRARAGHPGADTPGRPAIGATATLIRADGRRLAGQVDGGNGHSGKRSPDLQFGLGTSAPGEILTVDLAWRDPDGIARRESLRLPTGWQTIVLGWPKGGDSQ